MKRNYKDAANEGGVYRIVNLTNGKVYIGSTKGFKQRAYQHETRLNSGRHHNKHLLASWQKYGTEKFLFEILEVTNGTLVERRKAEQRYVDLYLKNWEECYNLNRYVALGDGPWSKTPELTRLKMRIAKLGKPRGPQGEETKRKIGLANSGKKRSKEELARLKIAMLGKRHSLKTRRRISETMKRKNLKPPSWKGKQHSEATKEKMSKTVYQLDSSGSLISTFTSTQQASLSTGVDSGSISKCCNGKRKAAGGFFWTYEAPKS
jgi:group I intron endonuclease